MCIADPLCGTPETSMTLLINWTPMQNKNVIFIKRGASEGPFVRNANTWSTSVFPHVVGL